MRVYRLSAEGTDIEGKDAEFQEYGDEDVGGRERRNQVDRRIWIREDNKRKVGM